MALNQEQVANRLAKLGWRVGSGPLLKAAVEDYQRGYHGPGGALLIDGKAGPKTQKAIEWSQARRLAGQGTASENFSFIEFLCKCGGRYSGCRRVRVHRDLIATLESYRDLIGRGVSVVSGYRCPAHNARVGGASTSQHVFGAAADVAPVVRVLAVERRRIAAGIGAQGTVTGLVRHLDRRDVSGVNPTGGTLARPTKWKYS